MVYIFSLVVTLVVSEAIAASALHGGGLGIYGGQDASPGQFPYQISLQRCSTALFRTTCEHFCGGSVIAPNWILTAGHCYESGMEHKIIAGITDKTEESEYKQVAEVNQTFVHADYIGDANPNDIRLYQLKTPLNYTERVQPINLPEPNYSTTGDGIISGWGESGSDLFPQIPNILQWEVINMPSEETCYDLCESINPDSTFNGTTNVCTENPVENFGICTGDSGGPLVQNSTLIGISSWGFMPCGEKNAPSVYTRVSNYIGWIKERVPELQNQ